MPAFDIDGLTRVESANDSDMRWVGKALRSIKNNMEQLLPKLGASITPNSSAPPSINSLTVTAANGIADCAITDNNSIFRAIQYFVEYSTDPAFAPSSTHQVQLGSARNSRIPVFLGATPVYFRAYSQYTDGPTSTPVNFGAPTGVNTGGAGPSLGTGQLAGTATSTGQGNGDDVSRRRAGLDATL